MQPGRERESGKEWQSNAIGKLRFSSLSLSLSFVRLCLRSENKSTFSRSLSHGFHSSVVKEASLVEDHAADVERFALLRNGRSDLGGRVDVRSRFEPFADGGRQGGGRAQGVALAVVARVVDHLGVNVLVRPENSQ